MGEISLMPEGLVKISSSLYESIMPRKSPLRHLSCFKLLNLKPYSIPILLAVLDVYSCQEPGLVPDQGPRSLQGHGRHPAGGVVQLERGACRSHRW